MRLDLIRGLLCAGSLVLLCPSPSRALTAIGEPLPPATLEWARAFGGDDDTLADIAVDGLGRVYFAGQMYSPPGLPTNTTPLAFLSRYDADGNEVWTRQWGSGESDGAWGVDVDATGGVYVAGMSGRDGGIAAVSTAQAFVAKYDAAGTQLWLNEFGTTGTDGAFHVTADILGNVFVTGRTLGNLHGTNAGGADVFVTKFNSHGAREWSRQIGTSQYEYPGGAAADDLGNLYIVGSTGGALGGPYHGVGQDAFLAKYDQSGNKLWVRQLGSPLWDNGNDVAVDALGNVFVAGETAGSLAGPIAGQGDGWVANFDSAGNQRWIRQFGGEYSDSASALATDGYGNVYVNGSTSDRLPGFNGDSPSSYLAKYDALGNLLWTVQAGAPGSDEGFAVATDGAGKIYVGGLVMRGGTGFKRMFLAKVREIPEPTGLTMALGMAMAVWPGFRFRRPTCAGRHGLCRSSSCFNR